MIVLLYIIGTITYQPSPKSVIIIIPFPPLALLLFFQVMRLVERDGGLVFSLDDDGWSPLNLTSFNGHVSVAAYLLDKGGA